MLIMNGIEPIRFAAVCDECGAREEPIEGTRPEVIQHLRHRSWQVTEEGKTTKCADCAGPPSVFPAGRLTEATQRCSVCGTDVDVCAACEVAFGPKDVISCRKEFGHTHARCSTQKFPRFLPPSG